MFILTKLEEFGIEINIIAGNHDRHFRKTINYTGTYVHFYQDDIIKLNFVDGSPSIYLAHDMLCPSKLQHDHSRIRWFNFNRKNFSHVVPETSLVIFGHTHVKFETEDKKSCSIAPFSFDIGEFSFI